MFETSLRNSILSPYRTDTFLLATLKVSTLFSGLIAVIIAVFLFKESLPALNELGFLRFLSDLSWHPAPYSGEASFNLVPMLVGTLAVSTGAVLLATPLGLASALFSQFYASKRMSSVYRKVIELLAGIPSVVFGFWGLVTLVPILNQFQPPGASLLAGILILTLMILPTVTLVSESAFSSLPLSYTQGAEALGLSRWNAIRSIYFPAARSGLLTAIVLQSGRALGETMAVLMVCGNIAQIPDSIFAPVRTLTANIALEMAYAMDTHRSALFVSGLVLLILVSSLVVLTEFLRVSNGK